MASVLSPALDNRSTVFVVQNCHMVSVHKVYLLWPTNTTATQDQTYTYCIHKAVDWVPLLFVKKQVST
jgi:hypothetical protein